jgi:hypothetical protein
LTEVLVLLHGPAEQASPLRRFSATGKGFRIEFEDEPPIHWLAGGQQR